MTESEFIEKYHPEEHPDGGYYRERHWDDLDGARVLSKAVSEGRCWTMMTGDDGEWFIEWGNHVVNRLFNVVTKFPGGEGAVVDCDEDSRKDESL